MENKKTKLTISGIAKKSIKNIEIAKTQGKKSVLIDKTKKNFVKKGSSFRPSSAGGRFKFAVIAVLTKPGLTVRTLTPEFWIRCRSPERNAVNPDLAHPY